MNAASSCVSQRVMSEVYRIIVHSYIEHLVKTKLSKLRKCWSFDVGQAVARDARLLHDTTRALVRSTV